MPSVSYEYGKALFELSCELNLRDEFLLQVRYLRNVFKTEKELISILSSPVIQKDERNGIIDRIFGGRIHEHICSFLKILTERGKAAIIPQCLEEFDRLWYENSGIVIAEAISATEMTEEQKTRLIRNLEERTGHPVELRVRTDPSLIGGLKITVGGELIDGSIKGRLGKLKEDLTGHIS